MALQCFIVICYAKDIDASAAFYKRLGLHLFEERHPLGDGFGKRHYSMRLSPHVVVELYPSHGTKEQGTPGQPGASRLMFEMSRESVDVLACTLTTTDGRVPNRQPAGQGSMLLLDPDGREVVIAPK